MSSTKSPESVDHVKLILENIKCSISSSFETFKVSINDNTITVHNHLADFKSKKDREGEYLNLHLLTLAYEFDLRINTILNEIQDDISGCDETSHLTAKVLEPGNILSIE